VPSCAKTGADQMILKSCRRNFQDINQALHVYFRIKPGQRHIHLAYHVDKNRCGVSRFPRFRKVLPIQINFAGNKGTNAYLLYADFEHHDSKKY